MRRVPVLLFVVLGVLAVSVGRGDEKNLPSSWTTHKQIKASPDKPMPYYRKAQCLMRMGRSEDGYKTAQEAMKVFEKANISLAWMLLEKIDVGRVRVDIHFNMGPKERKPPTDGIVKPVSFRVWSKDKEGGLLGIIDFEIGMIDGKPETAALGQEFSEGHANFGILPAGAKYEQVRKKAVELIKERYSKP